MQLSRFVRAAEVLGISSAVRLAYARLAKSGQVRVWMRDGACTIRAGSSDVAVVVSVLVETDYSKKLRAHCGHLPISHVIDAGANIGVTTRILSSIFPNSRTTAIEPDVENFKLLTQNTSDLSRVKAVRAGLWSEDTTLQIANPNAPAWSFHMEQSTQPGGLPAVTLASLTRNDAPLSVFLKMDVEGAEKRVLESLPEIVGERIGGVLIETHDRKEPGSGAALARFLSHWDMNVTVLGESILGYRKQIPAAKERRPS